MRTTIEDIERMDSINRARERICERRGGHTWTRYPAEIGCAEKEQHCTWCGKPKGDYL